MDETLNDMDLIQFISLHPPIFLRSEFIFYFFLSSSFFIFYFKIFCFAYSYINICIQFRVEAPVGLFIVWMSGERVELLLVFFTGLLYNECYELEQESRNLHIRDKVSNKAKESIWDSTQKSVISIFTCTVFERDVGEKRNFCTVRFLRTLWKRQIREIRMKPKHVF